MSLRNFYRALWEGRQIVDELPDVERDCRLQVSMNDTRCELVVHDQTGQEAGRLERRASENVMETKALLLAAVEALSPELERRIGNVVVFLDDKEISVVDSRQAKISNFEGRALAEFGKYQLGGKPACFASHRFGETSAQEMERRIIAYISEDRLTSVLFALGKLARFTTFFGPWSLQSALASKGDGTRAHLAVHSDYSTLTLANESAGVVAVRHLSIGTANLVRAYAVVHGIESKAGSDALGSRKRLPTGEKWPLAASAPTALTGTYIALAPVLGRLSDEVNATADYFEFQRLAGRAGELQLAVFGSRIAGFGRWLSDMLQIKIDDVTPGPPPATASPVLNLLEGMRTGLLKVGNQSFDFTGGRFVPSATAPARNSSASVSKWKSASSQEVTLQTFKPAIRPLAAAAVLAVAIAASYAFVLAPAQADNQTRAALYSSMLARLDQSKSRIAPAAREPVLWARDMLAVGSAMPYDMKLKRVALTPGTPSNGAVFEISGSLPKNGEGNLQLIGHFMKRLGATPALRQRFGELSFGGSGQGANNDASESVFRIVGKVTVAVHP